jgi:hypothetical protein
MDRRERVPDAEGHEREPAHGCASRSGTARSFSASRRATSGEQNAEMSSPDSNRALSVAERQDPQKTEQPGQRAC